MSIRVICDREVASQYSKSGEAQRLLILGKTYVGKSSILLRVNKDKFDPCIHLTIGANFGPVLEVTIGNGSRTILCTVDISNESSCTVARFLYKTGIAALVVYSDSEPGSLEVAKQYIRELEEQEKSDLVIALVRNKSDLPSDADQASVQEFATQNGYVFAHVSAKTGQGIEDLFLDIASRLTDKEYGIRQAKAPEPEHSTEVCLLDRLAPVTGQ
eukprot:scpid94764/ scgid16694/ Vacuolar protein sorting-associated protein 21; GTP-binding protein YPT51; Vacuolar protein-targeting protein 12